MFNGHIDTVTLTGYQGNPLSGEIVDGHFHGRGSVDMKSGIAASMIALVRGKRAKLDGNIIFAGVADEEDLSAGTEHFLAAGWRADGAIVSEPTMSDLVHAHKGFVWLEVNVKGAASHGSRPDLGIDAIVKAGHFLVALDTHAKNLMDGSKDKNGLTGTIHASPINGGEESSSYPANCTIVVERRTVFGETAKSVEGEVRSLLDSLVESVEDFNYECNVTFERNPFECPPDATIIGSA